MSRAEHGPELNAARVFAALAKHGVDYVLIGGVAAQAHGQMRTTFDLDILPRPDGANLQRLARAPQAIEARALKPGAEGLALDAQTLPRATIWQLSTRYGLIDVLHQAPGAPAYQQLRARALEVELEGIAVPIASRA